MTEPAKPPLPEFTEAKKKAFVTSARKFLDSRPNGDKDLRRASKLYGKKE